MKFRGLVSVVGVIAAAVTVSVGSGSAQASSTDFDAITVPAPAGSEGFGRFVEVLPNGNYVVVDQFFDDGPRSNVGAIYLFDGEDNSLISRLIGATASDFVGGNGEFGFPRYELRVVGDSNFVVGSPNVDVGGVNAAGAFTWISGTTGLNGTVSAANSMVGSSSVDVVGSDIVLLENGNYVVNSVRWDNGAIENAGAVTWGSGNAAITGVIGPSNSLVGTTTLEAGGGFDPSQPFRSVTALTNGDYVIATPGWDSPTMANIGAVTWATGDAPITGPISAAGSLTGTASEDQIGSGSVTRLSNGNYVFGSPKWTGVPGSFGAVTWVNGSAASTGVVSTSNSLYGGSAGDSRDSVTALPNGNYVVATRLFNSGVSAVGAATWGNGATGTSGEISTSNSLYGSTALDLVGQGGVAALADGNYVVVSPSWDNGSVVNAGAVTWGNGSTGSVGAVSTSNSLHGTHFQDNVGEYEIDRLGEDPVHPLPDGGYVVLSEIWGGGLGDAVGAITVAAPGGTTTGAVSPTNSLHGSTDGDRVGQGGAVTVGNGDVVVGSPDWAFGSNPEAGAVTFIDRSAQPVGPVSAANSLHGSTTNDRVGTVTRLADGNYVVQSAFWDNGSIVDAGAVTWVSGATGRVGPISTTNSLHGTQMGERVGLSIFQTRVREASVFADGSFMTRTSGYDSGIGAITLGKAGVGVTGPITTANSVIGDATSAVGIGTTQTLRGRVFVFSSEGLLLVDAGITDPPTTSPDFVSLVPARILDTRTTAGADTIDDRFLGGGARPPGSTLTLDVAGRANVPSDAVAVALNLTAVGPTSKGFVTAYPCNVDRPTASNLNTTPGRNTPNAVNLALAADGTVCLYTLPGTHLVADVTGYYPAESAFIPRPPARLYDSRPTGATIDDEGVGAGRTVANVPIEIKIGGRAAISTTATSAAINITIAGATARGFATVYPCTATVPTASTINYAPGRNVANAATLKLSANSSLCVVTSQPVHVMLDVNGSYPSEAVFEPVAPLRLLDTREASPRPAGSETEVIVVGRPGAPTAADTVVLNVTATRVLGQGFVTVYPCGIVRPNASNLNVLAGDTIANNVTVKVGTGGKVCLFTSAPTDLIVDINGYHPPA